MNRLRTLALAVGLLSNVIGYAYDFEVDGIYYNITSSDDLTVEVTYRGDYGDSYDEYHDVISIPSSVVYNLNTYRVTSIGNSAFHSCGNLISAIIPEGVVSIGSSAFNGCTNLVSIMIPKSVTSMGTSVFRDCSSLVSIDIPNGVPSIGWYMFEGCSSLSSISIPKSVESIGWHAFFGCSSLSSIILPDKTTRIEDRAFYGCNHLSSIFIPESVKSIASGVFYNCVNLTSVSIPNSVENIEDETFYGCNSLNFIVIPEKVKSIGASAFEGCYNLASVVIPNGVASIGERAFYGCNNLTSITLPCGVTSIENDAFYDCAGELYVNCDIPTASSYYDGAFYRSKFTKVVIGESVTSIGDYAFYKCDSFTSITIPKGVTSIGNYAFYGCNDIKSLVVGGNVSAIGNKAFSSPCKVIWLTNNPPTGYEETNGMINYVPNEKYTKLSSKKVYPYLSSLFEIGGTIFVPNPAEKTCDVIDCNYLAIDSHVKIGNAITYKGMQMKVNEVMPYAFYDNDSILSVTIDNTGNVGEKAFSECSNIEDAVFGDGVVSVGANAFSNCRSMKSFEIGRGIKDIDENAFLGCSAIEQFTCYAKQAPKCGPMALDDIDKWNCTLKVPEKAVDRYKAADQWESFFFVEGFQVEENVVTFVVDGETYGTVGVEYGEEITLLDAPQKEGYTFCGWQDVPEVMPTEDIAIYGYFTINKYAVNYMVDGKVYQTDSVTYNDPIVTPDGPIKEGYTFSGWNNVPETMPACDVTISGSFTINKYLVTFKIGDEVIASDSLEYATTIVVPEAPEKEGHTFNGWGQVDRTVPAYDVIYEGIYSVNSYNLIYMVDDMVYRRESVTYNAPITVIEEPVKEGYSFCGWSEVPETMPANDVTVCGTFAKNKYLVTFKIDGVVVAADSLEYGTSIIAPTVPEREGYTFSGWGKTVGTVPANDVTFEGTYTVNIYKVYYFVGSTLVHTEKVAYGEAIPEYVYEPTEESHTFLGWIGETYETMPAHDVSYTANITNDVLQWTIDNGQLTIYDLTGRKVTNAESLRGGIYIVNGQKMIIND